MIYFVRCGKTEFVKIGTAKNVVSRLNDLQLSNPLPLTLLAVMDGDWHAEQRLHRRFKAEHHAGEWFVISDRLRAFILRQIPAYDFYDGLKRNPRRAVRLDASFIADAP